jgi:hypothetical protein
MFAPTYYYYIMLVVPLLYLASQLEAPINAFGLVWLYLSSHIACLFYDTIGRQLALFYALSLLLLVLCLIMATAALLRALGLELALCRTEPVLGARAAAAPVRPLVSPTRASRIETIR